MSPVLAIAVLCLLIWFNQCCVHGYGHYDEDPDSDGEPSYYGHGTHYSGGCDIVSRIGHERQFSVYNFPLEQENPELQTSRVSPFGPAPRPQYYHNGRLPPEQCTWEFQTRVHDNCVLEFSSHYFERGDIECEQQYLLIGDEYGEKR